jgi:hypothetical protein
MLMDMERTLGMDLDTAAETRLWQAVILSAVEDWVSGGLRTKREADAYLFDDQDDFPRVCESAGMDVGRIRSRLKRLRRKSAGGAAGPKPKGAQWPGRKWQSAAGNSAEAPRV